MPTVYDCRKDASAREPGSIQFPCKVRIICPVTGKPITNVFYVSTSPAKVGRYLTGPDGQPLAKSTGKMVRGTIAYAKSIDWIASKMPPKLIVPELVKEYVRLESFEARRWLAVAKDTGEVIAKSEGVD